MLEAYHIAMKAQRRSYPQLRALPLARPRASCIVSLGIGQRRDGLCRERTENVTRIVPDKDCPHPQSSFQRI